MFRTAAGFHDAYVAAPSRKAALAAWGADTDLFTAGIAEQVEDAALMREALKRPGEVVKKARGTKAEWAKAAQEGKKDGGSRPSSGLRTGIKSGVTEKKKPSRAALERAEAAVAALEEAQLKERGALAAEEERLRKKRRALEASQEKAMAAMIAKRDAAEEEYRTAPIKNQIGKNVLTS